MASVFGEECERPLMPHDDRRIVGILARFEVGGAIVLVHTDLTLRCGMWFPW
ncbi:hypothetical protein ABH922_002969 [Rhodococcus sp. 27YEA15]|uniref:hypothetical protein n=1 Tax=Rhodococcus sp. 27YEA15 TaxID=3156259 RepID=UPI003C7B40EE